MRTQIIHYNPLFFKNEIWILAPKMIYKCNNKCMRRCPTLVFIRKMQINTTIRYYYILLRIAKDRERERETIPLLIRRERGETGTLHWETFNVKDPFAIQPNNPTPRYLSKRNENSCLHKNLSTDIYSSCIYNIKKLGITQMFFSWWLNKVWYTDTREPYSTRQRNELLIHPT